MPSTAFRVHLTELSPTMKMIAFTGDLSLANASVIRQVFADHNDPGRQLIVDLSRAGGVEHAGRVLPCPDGNCIIVTGGRNLADGAHTTVATVAEARAVLTALGCEFPADQESPATELDLRTLRNRALIADALAVLQQRYGLSTTESAFALLSKASQQHNVPVRTLAAAVIRVPAPKGTTWFPGRRKTPQPPLTFVTEPPPTRTTRGVIRSLLRLAVTATDATSGNAQSVAPLDDGLVLESVHGMPEQLARDCTWISLTETTPCTRALQQRVRVVADVSTDEAIRPDVREMMLAHGIRSTYSTPLTTPDGRCLGVVTTHHPTANGIDDGVLRIVDRFAAETGRWLDWHRRTVVFDALERLHQLAGSTR